MLSVQHFTVIQNQDLRTLIRDLSFTLSGTERLAVIGEEGNGKSTLLKAIAEPDRLRPWAEVTGKVSCAGERIGYLAQEAPAEWSGRAAYEICMESPAFAETKPGELAALCRQLSMDQGLCWAETPFGQLSGGEKVRLRMLTLLCERPTMLLLDEPGNDLDTDALEALERYLLCCALPVMYVSHDEALLRSTATQVLHLESIHGRAEPRWTWAREPYAAYTANRRSALDRQESLWKQDQRDRRIRDEKMRRIENAVEHAQAAISRADPHGGRLLKKKMKAVKSLQHRYEREDSEAVERPAEEYPMQALFEGAEAVPAGKTVLDLKLPELTAGDRVLAGEVALRVRGSEKVLLTGPNGAGKTTLLRVIERTLRQDASLRVALMPQRYEDLLDLDETPVRYLHRDGSKEQLTFIRSTLIAMKFSRDELEHPLGSLSGGQKAKVLLLRLMMARPNVLLMDEPTRNLSPLSAPVMREAVCSFPGAVICVTHDRLLMERWPGRILRLGREGLMLVQNPA